MNQQPTRLSPNQVLTFTLCCLYSYLIMLIIWLFKKVKNQKNKHIIFRQLTKITGGNDKCTSFYFLFGLDLIIWAMGFFYVFSYIIGLTVTSFWVLSNHPSKVVKRGKTKKLKSSEHSEISLILWIFLSPKEFWILHAVYSVKTCSSSVMHQFISRPISFYCNNSFPLQKLWDIQQRAKGNKYLYVSASFQ